MSIKYSTMGDTVSVFELNEETTKDKLKPRIYSVMYSMERGFYLNIVRDRFDAPKKLFGSIDRRIEKIINTYNSRETSTGILLTGDKGSGKTRLSESLSNKMIDAGLPIILVNEMFSGEAFNSFIEKLQECVLLFDEFGKVYSKERNEQDALLTLMDGVNSSKRLIILTENLEHLINDFMIGRPGRIYYHFRYSKVEEDVIEEYSEGKVSKKVITDIIEFSRKVKEFSFDTLKTIIEEVNRFNLTVEESVQDLNIQYDVNSIERGLITKVIDKLTNKEVEIKVSSMFFNLTSDRNWDFYIDFKDKKDNKNNSKPVNPITLKEIPGLGYDEDEDEDNYHTFNHSDLKYKSKTEIIYEDMNYILIAEIQESSPMFAYGNHF